MKKNFVQKMYRGLLILLLCGSGIVFFMLIFSFLDIQKLSNIPQSTVIQDRNGKELFRFFEEDRRRVSFDQIAPDMIHAIIAVEDQTFWTNNGTDKSGLLRAIVANIEVRLHDTGQLQGGSTITQQLVKNIYLTKQKTISRKIQELILATQLTNKLTRSFRAQGIVAHQAKRKAKEAIVTAYLNYVFFGNHSYGIDAAAKNYFHTSARELTLLQSAVLASLPQAPSLYNPTMNQETIMGERTLTEQGGTGASTGIALTQSGIYDLLQNKPLELTKNCVQDIATWATISSGDRSASYTHGRKDRVLCRMRETKAITDENVRQAFLEGQSLVFHKARYSILAPHFVYWIQQLLYEIPFFAQQGTTYDQLSQGGYTIVTTLDYDRQRVGEDALGNYVNRLKRLGGNNRALLHVDATNGDVLAYIGSQDFYDEQIDGQVDVLRSIRQVGSTLKPFFYAYLFTHYPFTIEGNIVDFPLPIAKSPQNHDGGFWGKTSLATALAGSRNLPVVRLFLALGGEKVFVPYLQSLGFTSLDPTTKKYGYPLALGADEATLLQLAQAYVQLSCTGEYYPTIQPIQRILRSDGKPLFEKPKSRYKKIIPDTVADMIRRILVNKHNMPEDRRWLRNLPLEFVALKTGTSDIKVNGKPLPRDGVSIVYNATDVIVSRAGNTDGSAMGPKAFGGEINHYPLRQYLQDLVDAKKIVDHQRITTPSYHQEGRYAGVDHDSLTKEQEQLLRRGGN